MKKQSFRKSILFILLTCFFPVIFSGCAGQSWKDALSAPLEGRGQENVAGFLKETSDNQEINKEKATTQASGDNGSTEENAKDTVSFPYVDDSDWVRSEWPKEYDYMKNLSWNNQKDVLKNGNIQKLLEALTVLEGNWPGVSQREVSWKSLKEEGTSYFGENIWYERIWLNRIEKVQAGSKESKAINDGKAYAVLHTSCTLGDEGTEILMYVMNLENLESFYPEKKVGQLVNITGWYVGETDGKPSIVYPGLAGG